MGLGLSQFGGQASLSGEPGLTTLALAESVQTDVPIQIDIRTASPEELELLPGIGPKRAQDIIAYRSAHPFRAVTDLLEVKGIGPKTLNKLLPSLLIFGTTPVERDSLGLPYIPENLLKGSNLSLAESAPKKSASTASQTIPKGELTNIVNLNTAGISELCTLPGIGDVKARAVIAHREANGPFASVDDFVKVKGIGPKTLEKLRSRLSVR